MKLQFGITGMVAYPLFPILSPKVFNMRVLAFDTTTSACSVAICVDGKTAGSFHEPMIHGQAEALVPAIEKTMTEAGITYADLDRIAVTVGPGSFTGVRVGLATARGIGVATGQPVIGVLTTEVIAAETHNEPDQSTAVAIDARRAEVYLQCFAPDGSASGAPLCLLPKDAATVLNSQSWILVGDGAARVHPHAKSSVVLGDVTVANAAILAQLAASRPLPESPPGPVYVRPPDAIVPKHGGRLRP
ncbi:MAG: tRNA (adenosine(37)-N6)-threonylcarbamoyltransferase complex dimerization subunit type 1 TsaB [Alphaproteobacteria bacterium]|nr:tRNA (adenosine(37)-N6)-threonylcarbamoyltransferase complex dimerization subunit type 1 TsaB [Alphaproteobacteria bacterium]